MTLREALMAADLDKVPVSTEQVTILWKREINTEDELQSAIMQSMTDGPFHSWQYIGKLGKMLQTANKKGVPLCYTHVSTVVVNNL